MYGMVSPIHSLVLFSAKKVYHFALSEQIMINFQYTFILYGSNLTMDFSKKNYVSVSIYLPGFNDGHFQLAKPGAGFKHSVRLYSKRV